MMKLQVDRLEKGKWNAAPCVMPWVGDPANIPDGWALADGTNGTEDARQKFTTREWRGVFPRYPYGTYPIPKTGQNTDQVPGMITLLYLQKVEQ